MDCFCTAFVFWLCAPQDVHHGNGTEEIMKDLPFLFFASVRPRIVYV